MKSITLSLRFFLIIASFTTIFCKTSNSQELRWRALPTKPFSNYLRFEDVYFINESTGWVIALDAKIYKTTNSGFTWIYQNVPPASLPRTISFINENTGWVGLLDSAGVQSMLLQTTNGGSNWTFYNNFDGPRPRGLCGMRIVNDSVAVVVGKVRGPAYFLKTTNAGINWVSKDMNQYNFSLIDCYFFNNDSGFAVGGVDTTPVSRPQILFTSDGGENWVIRATGTTTEEYSWKLSFPSRDTGYASIQNNSDSGNVRFFKTLDGGVTWTENLFLPTYFFEQGIGFVNVNTGWIGGDTNTYGTTDGGATWFPNTYIKYLNKIRFLSDTLGFAVGNGVYKYSRDTTVGIIQISTEVPGSYLLEQNFPNPFNPSTKIQYHIAKEGNVKISVYDITGKEITRLLDGVQSSGIYSLNFEGAGLPSGVYFYRLEAGEFIETKKMLLIK